MKYQLVIVDGVAKIPKRSARGVLLPLVQSSMYVTTTVRHAKREALRDMNKLRATIPGQRYYHLRWTILDDQEFP